MSRRYDEPVDVRRRDELPAEFLWRGRLYVVRDVFSSWIENRPWWTSPSARAVYSGDEAAAAVVPPTVSLLADSVAREIWRVEASPGRAAGPGVYDLSFAESTGQWSLVQVVD